MSKATKANEKLAADSFSHSQLDGKGFPAPSEGFIITHLLIVADQDRSRDFYSRVLGGKLLVNVIQQWFASATVGSLSTRVVDQPTTSPR